MVSVEENPPANIFQVLILIWGRRHVPWSSLACAPQLLSLSSGPRAQLLKLSVPLGACNHKEATAVKAMHHNYRVAPLSATEVKLPGALKTQPSQK